MFSVAHLSNGHMKTKTTILTTVLAESNPPSSFVSHMATSYSYPSDSMQGVYFLKSTSIDL